MNHSSTIHTITSIKQVMDYVLDGALIFFDLDNTLVAPLGDFGSEHWEKKLIEELMKIGLTKFEALERASLIWQSAQFAIQLRPLENDSLSLLNHLAQMGYRSMGLTSRSLDLISPTHRQLEEIDLSFFDPIGQELILDKGQYSKGIIFCNACNKGKMVSRFLHQTHFPKQIIAIDDRLEHLQDIQQALSDLSIPFIGLRHAYCDQIMSEFKGDPSILYFCQLFQNSHAKKMLIKSMEIN